MQRYTKKTECVSSQQVEATSSDLRGTFEYRLKDYLARDEADCVAYCCCSLYGRIHRMVARWKSQTGIKVHSPSR